MSTFQRNKGKQTNDQSNEDLSKLMPASIPDLSTDEKKEPVNPIDVSYFQKYGMSIADSDLSVRTTEERMCEFEKRNTRNSNTTIEMKTNNSLYLFNTLLRIFNAKEYVNNCIDIVIAHFYQNRDNIYHTDFLYSHTHLITRDEDDRDTFMKLLNVFSLLSNPAIRFGADTSFDVKVAIGTIPSRYTEISVSLINYLAQQRA